MKEKANVTPLEELMESDLKHYEEASSAVHEWHSGIPQAIRFYHQDRIALQQQIKELEEQNRLMRELGSAKYFEEKSIKQDTQIKELKELVEELITHHEAIDTTPTLIEMWRHKLNKHP